MVKVNETIKLILALKQIFQKIIGTYLIFFNSYIIHQLNLLHDHQTMNH